MLRHQIRILPLLFGVLLALLSAATRAQSHQREVGDYILRATVVPTATLAEESARTHGIERADNRAILNVIVFRKDDPQQRPVPARVNAYTTTLAGVRHDVALREISANGRVSYSGTFEFLPREVLDIGITALPAEGQQTLNLQFRERIWKER